MDGKIFVLVLALALVGLLESASIKQVDDDESPQITVRSLGGDSKQVAFDSEHDTVAGLRAKVAEMNGGRAENLRLVYAGRQLEDGRLLGDYGIQRDSTVISLEGAPSSRGELGQRQQEPIGHLQIKKITGEVFELPVRDEMSVDLLKCMVAIEVMIDLEAIKLVHNGVVLSDDSKTLSECGLQNGSTVMVVLNTASGLRGAVQPSTAIRTLAMEDGIVGQLVEALVMQVNEKMIEVAFEHNVELTNIRLVQTAINDILLSHLMNEPSVKIHFTHQIMSSENLRLNFVYKHRGERESIVASLKDGAQWVVDQAQAAMDLEKFERDLAATKEGRGLTSSTTRAPSL